jgi:hypothetical protein
MNQVIYPKTRATREVRKRIPCQDGRGFTSVPDGQEEIFYETSIDLNALRLVAEQAARNKKGTSKDGPLFVRIIARRRI